MILDDIKLKQKRLKEKNEKIEELKYEKDLIENDLINYIKTELFNSWDYNLIINNITVEKAWKYFHYKKEMKEKESKEHKAMFDYVITTIKEQILNNDDNYKLVEIYDYCFSTAYEFLYDYNGIKISISIPMYNNANKENYITLLGGYYIRYESSPSIWNLITNNIDYKQTAEELKIWIKNHKES